MLSDQALVLLLVGIDSELATVAVVAVVAAVAVVLEAEAEAAGVLAVQDELSLQDRAAFAPQVAFFSRQAVAVVAVVAVAVVYLSAEVGTPSVLMCPEKCLVED